MPYPTSDELTAFLEGAGLTGTIPGLDHDALIASAVAMLEAETGYAPFLSTGADVALEIPFPSAGATSLPTGLLTIATVRVGQGTTLARHTQYQVGPIPPAGVVKPYEYIRFMHPYSSFLAVTITGKWGRVLEIPDAVKIAILGKAATLGAGSIAQSITGGLAKWSDADTSETYQGDGDPLAAACARWEGAFSRIAEAYKRVAIGV